MSIAVSPDQMALSIDGVKYITRFFKVQAGLLSDEPAKLVTVISTRGRETVDRAFLEDCIQSNFDTDDVFHQDFLRCIILEGDESDVDQARIQDDVAALLEERRTSLIRFVAGGDPLPPGPYYLDKQGLHQLYKVQDDFNNTFVASCLPPQSTWGKWKDGRVSGSTFSCLGIPTPSRLYFKKSENLPLNGLRIAVKDIFHMNGLRTSLCSKAYLDLCHEQTETAECLQRLVRKGAQLVGKTHLSSFAGREEPVDCIDFQAPFNPRGDGYQSPAGSSSGSGAAIASYEWLDFALGTDNTGSGRRPGLWNGSFALRPSEHLVSTVGMIPTCPEFNVPSFFGRDITKFQTLMKAWYERPLAPASCEEKPWSVVYPVDYMNIGNDQQLDLVEKFAKDLCEFLRADMDRLSISERWGETTPVDEISLDRYMNSTREHGFFYDAYHCFDSFRAEYQAEFGKPPYVSPPTQWMWQLGALVSEEQRDHAMHRFQVFRRWFLAHILAVGERNTLMILPIARLEPRYRDSAQELPPNPPESISVLYLSPIIGAPELVVPIGHVPYHSRITARQEMLPAAVAVLAAPDMDLQLVDVIERFLKSTGRPTEVQTGSVMW